MTDNCHKPAPNGIALDRAWHRWSEEKRHAHGRKLAALTDDEVRAIRRRRAAGESRVAIAEDYAIGLSTISEICNRKSYEWVD